MKALAHLRRIVECHDDSQERPDNHEDGRSESPVSCHGKKKLWAFFFYLLSMISLHEMPHVCGWGCCFVGCTAMGIRCVRDPDLQWIGIFFILVGIFMCCNCLVNYGSGVERRATLQYLRSLKRNE